MSVSRELLMVNVNQSKPSVNDRSGNWFDLLTQPKVGVAAAALALGSATTPSLAGGLESNLTLDPQHIALGQEYLVGGSALTNTGGGTCALLLTSPTQIARASAGMLNSSWGFSALHNFTALDPFGGYTGASIALGANYNTSPGIARNILQVIPAPGGLDLCLFRVDPIAEVNPAVLGTFNVGDILTHDGFGRYGSQATGDLPRDGNVRAVRAAVSSFSGNGYDQTYYSQTAIDTNSGVAMQGRSLIGDSGGGVYNVFGETVGANIATTNGFEFFGETTFIRFDNPMIHSWIVSTVPAPGSALALGGLGILAARRRRA